VLVCTHLCRSGVDTASANEKYPAPTPVERLESHKVAGVAAGTNVSACFSAEGQLWLWGSNVNYQLAKGDTEEVSIQPWHSAKQGCIPSGDLKVIIKHARLYKECLRLCKLQR
jgi:alpha-tubulin suppressor-like RCC1 family protein